MAAKKATKSESARIRRIICEKRAAECHDCGAPGVHVDEEDGSVYGVELPDGERVDAQITVSDLAQGERILANGRRGGAEVNKLFCDDCAGEVRS